jgi:hypothetical protein
MSGLIWSGIGQGIANAGQTIGGMMMKDIEYQRQLQAEDRKETNYLKRLEEAQRIKDEAAEKKAEALQQQVIKETTAAQAAGAEVPSARMAGQLKTVQGQIAGESPAMSEAELQQLIKDNPQYKKIYEEAGYVTKRDERLERAEGAILSAMAAGAHSTTKKDLEAERVAVLKQIDQEFKERKEETREKETTRRLDQTDVRLELLGKDTATRARNADTYASRVPGGGGGKGGGGGGDNLTLQSIKANLAAADNDIKSVDKRIGTLESQKKNQSRVEREVTDGKIAELELNKKELSKRKTEYQTQLGTFTSARTGTAAPAAATGNRPALSTFSK